MKIVYYGNDILRDMAREIKNIDGTVRMFIDGMFKTMYKARGIGLAAPQVAEGSRIITIDIDDGKTRPLALINPVIKETSKETIPFEEGCLSLPGLEADVVRPSKILVKYMTPEEKEVEMEVEGLLARVMQHEIDHLNGILFVDHLEDYIQKELRPQLKKIRRMGHA